MCFVPLEEELLLPRVDCTGVNFDVALYCILGTAALGNTLRGVGWLGGDQGQGERRCEWYTALHWWYTAAALVVHCTGGTLHRSAGTLH